IRQFMAEFVIGGWIPIDIFSELTKNPPQQGEFDKQEGFDEQSGFDERKKDDESPQFDINSTDRQKPHQQMDENGDIIDADFNVEDERNPK
ncbi:MAG: hypothetical protein OXT03_03230, partial [Alphaproteobacteria bacterium]|nr:hypothetical protein [Alphaproteobacteria bacterium]